MLDEVKLGVGTATCWCSQCKEMFNSVAAFDAYLDYSKGAPAIHDYSWMPKNAKGWRVTKRWEDAGSNFDSELSHAS